MSEKPEGWLGRCDRAIYDAERSIVVGALAMMSVTYVLTVIWSNMHQPYSAFEMVLVKMMGHGEIQEALQADPEHVAFFTGTLAPLILGGMTLVAMFLALWIRHRSLPEAERGEFPKVPTAGKAVLLTGGLYGLLKVVEVVPSRWLCLLTLVVLEGRQAGKASLPREQRNLPAFFGMMAGAVLLAIFFITKGGDAYGWNLGMTAILLMYVGLIGASMATRDRKHIRIDAVRKSLKGSGYHLYNFISVVITIIFTAFLAVMSVRYGISLVENEVVHTPSGLPQFVVAFPIGFGFIMMVLRFTGEAVTAFTAWRRGESAPAPTVEVH